ncbi:hypothetical protein RJ641_008307 [Dillenia turbinata]|uniref:Uncharacterized protein n=1 Tax=Dillenia turbinata TaxID=194707 RepID=A0AAN8V148_9MAGN
MRTENDDDDEYLKLKLKFRVSSLFLPLPVLFTAVRRGSVGGVGFRFSSNFLLEDSQETLLKKQFWIKTLLKFAAIDIGEQQSKQEVEQILEGNFRVEGRYRSISSVRGSNAIYNDIQARTSSGRIPFRLRSPKFYRAWLDARRVLQDWSRKKRFQPEIMSELVDLVKGPLDRHNGVVGDPRFDVLCARIVKYYSLKRFQRKLIVSIFGFGKSTSAKHHYHTNQKAELHLHDYEAEYQFYHDLVERPQLHMDFEKLGVRLSPLNIGRSTSKEAMQVGTEQDRPFRTSLYEAAVFSMWLKGRHEACYKFSPYRINQLDVPAEVLKNASQNFTSMVVHIPFPSGKKGMLSQTLLHNRRLL